MNPFKRQKPLCVTDVRALMKARPVDITIDAGSYRKILRTARQGYSSVQLMLTDDEAATLKVYGYGVDRRSRTHSPDLYYYLVSWGDV